MKKIFLIVFSCVLVLSILCSCKNDLQETSKINEQAVTLPINEPIQFTYSSGVGGWFTELVLKPDGSFAGFYHDSEMGEIGDDYPNGTVYECEFSGNFKDIKKINDYKYEMIIDSIETEKKEGKEWIKDKIRYVASAPFGMDGVSFEFYTPDVPVVSLPESFLNYKQIWNDNSPTLSFYGVYNKTTGASFFQSKN